MVKVDGPSDIEDGRIKEYSLENLAGDRSDGNLNDSKTKNLNNLGLYIQPSAGRLVKSKATENGEKFETYELVSYLLWFSLLWLCYLVSPSEKL